MRESLSYNEPIGIHTSPEKRKRTTFEFWNAGDSSVADFGATIPVFGLYSISDDSLHCLEQLISSGIASVFA